MGGPPENALTALNNVKSLRIGGMLFRTVQEVSCVIYLITSCPKLQELTIECETMNTMNDVAEPIVQFLRDQSSLYGVMKMLQRVRMSTFGGLEMEMEFVRFILAYAPVLDKISIWNYSCLLIQTGRRLTDKMKQFQRASPNVEIIVDEVDVED
ncbi:uncharacterized protein LOC132043934 [Lycium ferocissimum]|uniref:uncharacterized protein LOC132043934 n=1 Tax=Lycium ferocissimum TaxID=112874 RepID=UPI002815D2BA|nr:uncharacterized protein LOC132043934 [Lycium ferocissimum]